MSARTIVGSDHAARLRSVNSVEVMKALLVSFPGPSYLVGAMERSIQVKSLDEDTSSYCTISTMYLAR